MKTSIKNLFLLPALIAGLGLIPAGRVTAQTFTTLHSFTAILTNMNSDGANPHAGLVLSGNTLYGTAEGGGTSGRTAGTLFAVNTDGTGFTNLHSFQNSGGDGGHPDAGLILWGNTLYGTTTSGGGSGNGMVFKVSTDGTGFTLLHGFTSTGGFLSWNNDGANPRAGLVLSGTTLYGTAAAGGVNGTGAVFAVNTNGSSAFTNLHSFAQIPPSSPNTNSDGSRPYAGLVLLGNTLYGTANQGGSLGNGTVFAVNTDGTGFTNLYSFTATSGFYPYTNSDGANPYAGLLLSGDLLYGTAQNGGSSGNGTVFAINTNGAGFATLYSFTPLSNSTNSDGCHPLAGLILSANALYGTASAGGSSYNGTVFSLSLPPPPQLTIIPSGADVILTWPTNAAEFTLQSTTNLVSPAVWTTVSPAPVVVNGQNAVTNPISGTQQFYRLSQ